MKNIEYDIEEHTHRYAVWTAARAVQRSFTTTAKIKNAILLSDLRNQVSNSNWKEQDAFDEFHKKCTQKLIDAFEKENVPKVSYGRASKIIAIYLKTAVVIASAGIDKRCQFIHPPIDRILLSALAKKYSVFDNIDSEPWTQLTSDKYWAIANRVKESEYEFNWTLEANWDTQ